MIEADLQGKTSTSEDILTSCCLGLLRLLPDEQFLRVLSLARDRSGRQLLVPPSAAISSFDFWPWLEGAGEPDAIATVRAPSNGHALKLIIEIKHGSPKSGGDGDQLARYFDGCSRQFQGDRIKLVYLTHHRELPLTDIDESLLHSPTAAIYWLSWYDVHAWASRVAIEPGVARTERRVILTLRDYLAAKGYERFLGWVNCMTHEPVLHRQVPYYRDYQLDESRTRSQGAQDALYIRLHSLRTFTQPGNLPGAYQSVKE